MDLSAHAIEITVTAESHSGTNTRLSASSDAPLHGDEMASPALVVADKPSPLVASPDNMSEGREANERPGDLPGEAPTESAMVPAGAKEEEEEKEEEGKDASPTRLKRCHHKVRTGCVTCRRRRVKCDETHPRCLRCAKAGRVCEGYTHLKSWVFESSQSDTLLMEDGVPGLNSSNPIHLFDKPDLQRLILYFVECTAPRIARYFAEMMDSFLDDKALVTYSSRAAWWFWNRLVVQASQSQACVRYSMAAISSLHEWIELTKRTPWQNNTFTLYYTKAISEINQSQDTLPLEVILISCLLFAHCDFLMGASAPGLAHLKYGSRIISENRKRGVRIIPEIVHYIEPIIQGFLVKSENYKMEEETAPGATLTGQATYALPKMPEIFEHLGQASKYVQEAIYWVLLLELGKPHHLSAMTPGVRKFVLDWATAFGRWKASVEVDDPGSSLKDWQLLLLAQHRMALLILKTLPPDCDNGYSRATAEFRIMFAQLRTFLRSGYPNVEEEDSNQPVLKKHLGFITPLFFIATQCRAPDIRQNALDALQDLGVVEGHWNSCVAYAIAKSIIDIEATSGYASGTKPGRIKVDSVDRSRDGVLFMKYHKVPGNGSSDDIAVQMITEPVCHHEAAMQWPVVRVVQLHGFQGTVKPRRLKCACRH